jgi:SPP1 gp7 family putative phage head morphogenesis protein
MANYINAQKKVNASLIKNQSLLTADMTGEYKKALDGIRANLMQLQEQGIKTIEDLNKFNQLSKLQLQIEANIFKAIDAYEVSLNKAMENQFIEAYYKYAFIAMKEIGVSFNLGLVDNNLIKAAMTHKFQGGNLKETLKDLSVDAKQRIRDVMQRGLADGIGIDELSRSLKEVAGINAARAEKILRTELSRIAEDGKRLQMKEFKDKGAVTRFKWVATLDNRTRKQSAQMDGNYSNEEGKFLFPDGNWYFPGHSKAEWDINDRCTVIQEIDKGDLNGQPIDDTITFEQWAKQQGIIHNKFGEALF